MKKVRVLILKAPGTNRDLEAATAWTSVGATISILHINEILEKPQKLFDFDALTLPGGFSYGDDLGAGKVHALDLTKQMGDLFRKFVDSGRLVIGICNGFQTLVKTGIIPDVTLYHNDSGHFECRWIYLANVNRGKCIFTKGITVFPALVAHGEGRFVTGSKKRLLELEKNDQIVLKYSDKLGNIAQTYPENPNGSVNAITGICNETGTVFGLMPHPEGAAFDYQLPTWLRGEKKASGLHIFQNAADYLLSTAFK